MNIEFTEVLKAFLEVGLLGLCAIMMIVIFYENHRKSNETDDKKNALIVDNFKSLNAKMDNMVNGITEQNRRFVEFQEKQSEKLINAVISGVVNHVPTTEESHKLTNISNAVDKILQDVLLETNASRACLVQYHNGGKGINQQAFLKMSMTNEKTQLGVKSIMSECKDQFRSALGYFVNDINNTGHCCIFDRDEIKNVDIGIYELMLVHNVEAKCGYGIHNEEGLVIAYIGIEFEDKTKANKDVVRKSFTDHYREVERLLNL